MLRACCEYVTKMLRTRLLATSNIRSLPSLLPHVATMLRLYCGHVATRVACNIQHQEPLLPFPQHNTQHHVSATSKRSVYNIEKIMFATLNSTCLQHRDSASTTSKINGCNIQHQRGYPLDTIQNMSQHQKSTFATSKN
jgi:hypothetical protein